MEKSPHSKFMTLIRSFYFSIIIGIKIFVLSVLSFWFAAGILGFFMSDGKPIMLIAGPLLSFFGWFYFPFVLMGYVFSWFCWHKTKVSEIISKLYFCLLLSGMAAIIFGIVGIKEQGSLIQGIAGNSIGAFIAGFLSLWLLTGTWFKNKNYKA